MKLILLSFIALTFLSGCSSEKGKPYSTLNIAVTGSVGEILVVCDNDLWESEIKKCLDSNLTQFIMPYYPDVATFELIHKTPKHFTQGVKRYRNTLFISIDPSLKDQKPMIKRRDGVWATDQLVVDISAPDYNSLVKVCQQGLQEVHSAFDEKEWKRLIKQNKQRKNHFIDKKLAKNFGINIAIPDGARILTKRANFFRLEFPDISRPIEFVGTGGQDDGAVASGVMVYQYDFIDSSQLELHNLLQARDTMLRYNVPHQFEGMYMGTQYVKMVYPEANWSSNESGTIDGIEMRGMFQFKGLGKHGTGGAFWAYHFVHPKTKKLICISGYVDAPSTTSWTHPLRVVQAVFKSVECI
jgi:hypothetical protein